MFIPTALFSDNGTEVFFNGKPSDEQEIAEKAIESLVKAGLDMECSFQCAYIEEQRNGKPFFYHIIPPVLLSPLC